MASHLRRDFASVCDLPADWTASGFGPLDANGRATAVDLYLKPIDLHLTGVGNYFTAARANLPKLLYGHNGRLIAEEREFIKGFKCLHEHLSTVLELSPPYDSFIPGFPNDSLACHFTRIDLPWHFTPESGILSALASSEHSKIRSAPSYVKGTVSLFGSFLKLTAYDKIKQLRIRSKTEKDVIRFEARLSGKALTEIYRGGDGCGFSHLTFEWCRETLRRIAEEIHPDISARLEGTVVQYVADLERDYPLIRATDRYVFTKRMSRQTEAKFRRNVKRLLNGNSHPPAILEFFPPQYWETPLQIELPEKEAEHLQWQERYFSTVEECSLSENL